MDSARNGITKISHVDRVEFAHNKFVGEDFRNAEILDASGLDAEFENCDLRYSIIDGGYFRKATFSKCKFEGAKFINCNFKSARFYLCNLKFANFNRCLIDDREILATLPDEPNIRRDSLQNLKANAVEVGDYGAVKLFVLEEIKAAKLHLYYVSTGYSGYYIEKYPKWYDRWWAWIQLRWLTLNGLIWGHGEKPWLLLASCSVVLLGLGVANSFAVLPRMPWQDTGAGLWILK